MAGDSPYKQIVERSSRYFKEVGLKPFLLCLPLQGKSAINNQSGIRDKILKNNSLLRTCLYTKYNSLKNIQDNNNNITYDTEKNQKEKILTKNQSIKNFQDLKNNSNIEEINLSKEQSKSIFTSISNDPDLINFDTYKCLNFIHKMVDNLSNPDIHGFVLIIAEAVPEQEFRPVAGGIVELLDEHERSIRGLWCRWSLPELLANEIIKLSCMLLIAHAFEWSFPGRKNRSTNKLVSILDQTCLSFPKEANKFLMEHILMSKHWETQSDAGNHNDHPSCTCKCFKIADKQDAWMFWGISESRFIKQWKSFNLNKTVPDSCSSDYVKYFTKINSFEDNNNINSTTDSTNKTIIIDKDFSYKHKRFASPNQSESPTSVKRKALAI